MVRVMLAVTVLVALTACGPVDSSMSGVVGDDRDGPVGSETLPSYSHEESIYVHPCWFGMSSCDDGSQCTADRCTMHACVHDSVAMDGQDCTVGGDPGQCIDGHCAEHCSVSADCQAPAQECALPVCVGGICTPIQQAPNGTPCSVGSCQDGVCVAGATKAEGIVILPGCSHEGQACTASDGGPGECDRIGMKMVCVDLDVKACYGHAQETKCTTSAGGAGWCINDWPDGSTTLRCQACEEFELGGASGCTQAGGDVCQGPAGSGGCTETGCPVCYSVNSTCVDVLESSGSLGAACSIDADCPSGECIENCCDPVTHLCHDVWRCRVTSFADVISGPYSCDDNNDCTADLYLGSLGCSHNPLIDRSSCGDGVCQHGKCVGCIDAYDCDPSSECNIAACFQHECMEFTDQNCLAVNDTPTQSVVILPACTHEGQACSMPSGTIGTCHRLGLKWVCSDPCDGAICTAQQDGGWACDRADGSDCPSSCCAHVCDGAICTSSGGITVCTTGGQPCPTSCCGDGSCPAGCHVDLNNNCIDDDTGLECGQCSDVCAGITGCTASPNSMGEGGCPPGCEPC